MDNNRCPMTAKFEFETKEETDAFLYLLKCMPRYQRWGQARYQSDAICHICKNINLVKQGVIPYDNFFDSVKREAYTFWSCCESCNNTGWNIPTNVTDKIVYWVIENEEIKEKVIIDFKLFKFPSIMLVNLDTILLSV